MERVNDIDLAALCTGRKFHPSPPAWEDQVFYFVLLDRFSDGNEQGYIGNDGKPVTGGQTPVFDPAVDNGNAVITHADAAAWEAAGAKWCGGNLKGLTNKIGYLKRMGVTALWLSPIFKQVSFQPTYHGYSIQDFLSVDPHFGTIEDLRELVQTAHANGIYVILDIILNHTGNVFSYSVENGQPPWRGDKYPVAGFNDKQGVASLPFQNYVQFPLPVGRDCAVWPSEFQNPSCFTMKGRITNWGNYPEYREGDIFDLKDIDHGFYCFNKLSCYQNGYACHVCRCNVTGVDDINYRFSPPPRDQLDECYKYLCSPTYVPSNALLCLCEIYKYWIAAVDIDGYHVDTVKHMDIGAMRYFVSTIKTFTQSIGKEYFIMVGEITGGREQALNTMKEVDIDAALGIDNVQLKLERLIKGETNPEEYFNVFQNTHLFLKKSPIWLRDKVLTMIDDHDQAYKGEHKARLCAGGDGNKLVLGALALNAMTMGIPCIYYGTEQQFDGVGDGYGADRYIRETMFGGPFGAFRSKNRHFFDENSLLFRELATILKLRSEKNVLRRGRQYLREISGDGVNFGLPRILGGRMLSVVAWSRILDNKEMVLAVNTDPSNARKAWVLVDADLQQEGSRLKCVYSTNHADEDTMAPIVQKKGANGTIMSIELDMAAAGFVVLE